MKVGGIRVRGAIMRSWDTASIGVACRPAQAFWAQAGGIQSSSAWLKLKVAVKEAKESSKLSRGFGRKDSKLKAR